MPSVEENVCAEHTGGWKVNESTVESHAGHSKGSYITVMHVTATISRYSPGQLPLGALRGATKYLNSLEGNILFLNKN